MALWAKVAAAELQLTFNLHVICWWALIVELIGGGNTCC